MNVSSRENIHSISYSILMGFPSRPEMQLLFFGLFSVAYVLTLVGNTAMACAVQWDQRLHTPGYILLGNFSLLEICYITTTVLNMLANFLSTSKAISFVSCFAQCYFFSFGCDVGFYLCIMAIDRYLAVCHPLHYPHIMTRQLCTNLVIFGWSSGFILFITPVVLISQLPSCGPNIINHLLCDPVPRLMPSCSEDTTLSSFTLLSTLSSWLAFFSLSSVLCSSARIRFWPCRGRPQQQANGGFLHWCLSSVCGVLFFGSIMVMYVSPGSRQPVEVQNIVTLFYSVITPLCNPLIYSLRNKEMKAALRKIFGTETPLAKHRSEDMVKQVPSQPT